MYTLHWEYLAGSIVAQAMLEAAGADYRLSYVDMAAGEHMQPHYLSTNPAGRVPALTLPGGQTMGETAAIVIQLGEDLPQAQLTPLPGDKDRPAFLFWLNVMTTAGYQTAARASHPERHAETPEGIDQIERKSQEQLASFFDTMEDAISGDPFFLPGHIGALDFYLTMLTEWWSDHEALFATRPKLAKLCAAVRRTPAYLAAMRTHQP